MSTCQAFFLDAAIGERFCLYFPAHPAILARGGVVYVAPFAEEMNLSRQTVARQARALAEIGYAVLLIDLFGCGDSSGDFFDARWEIWKSDVLQAAQWLRDQGLQTIDLWGIRLGALLALDVALDVATTTPNDIRQLVLWQPVLDGKTMMTQFYRLLLASKMSAEGTSAQGGTKAIRASLAAGQAVEIAGYEIHPALANAIEALNASRWEQFPQQLHWVECGASATTPLAPARQQLFNQWQSASNSVHLHRLASDTFWSTPEVAINTELIALTQRIFAEESA